jgi:hypothetical protein
MYMGTAAISGSDYIHLAIRHADLIIMIGHDVVEKPPFFMHPHDKRKVIHVNYFTAQVLMNGGSWLLFFVPWGHGMAIQNNRIFGPYPTVMRRILIQ